MRSQAVAFVAFLAICIGSSSSKSVFRLKDDAQDPWNNTLMYQIEVGSYFDSDGDGFGDLQGIIDKFNYLNGLGVNAILLSPIYDETDWTKINSSLGNETILEDLINKFQGNDIQVILDFEITCTSNNHPWFTTNPEYYITVPKTIDSNWLAPTGGSAWVPNGTLSTVSYLQFFDGPELDYTNSNLTTLVTNILATWANAYNNTGFRIRHASYFIENKIDDKVDNEIQITGCTDSKSYICFDHSNTTNTQKNFDLLESLVKTLTKPKNSSVLVEPYFQFNYDLASEFSALGAKIATPVLTNFTMATNTDIMRSVLSDWMNVNQTNYWMFGNRDVSRASTRMGEDQLDSANILSMLLPGTLLVYYGEELGMSDVDGIPAPTAQRSTYQWNCDMNGGFSSSSLPFAPANPNYCRLNAKREGEEDPSYLSIFKKLTDLRKTVKDYGFELYDVNNLTLAFSRSQGDDKYIVLINTDNYSENYNLTQFLNLNGDEGLGVHSASWNSEYKEGSSVDLSNFTMRPWSGVILHSGSSIAQFSMFLILLGLAILRLQ